MSLGSAAGRDDLVVGLGILPGEVQELRPRELARLGDRPDGLVRGGVFLLGEREGRDHLRERGAHGAADGGGRPSSRRRRVGGQGIEEPLKREL